MSSAGAWHERQYAGQIIWDQTCLESISPPRCLEPAPLFGARNGADPACSYSCSGPEADKTTSGNILYHNLEEAGRGRAYNRLVLVRLKADNRLTLDVDGKKVSIEGNIRHSSIIQDDD